MTHQDAQHKTGTDDAPAAEETLPTPIFVTESPHARDRQRIAFVLITVFVAVSVWWFTSLSVTQQYEDAAPHPSTPIAVVAPPTPVAEPAPPPARQRSFKEQYARSDTLASHHGGVYVTQIDGRRAVLSISTASTLAYQGQTVQVPRLSLYIERDAAKGPPLVDLVPMPEEEFQRFAECRSTLQYRIDEYCYADQWFGTLGEFTADSSFTFIRPGAAGDVTVSFRRVEDSGLQGAATRSGDATLFERVIAQGSVPEGKPVTRDGFTWQPMVHPPTGVRWDRLTEGATEPIRAVAAQELESVYAKLVGEVVSATAEGRAGQASMRITFANPHWLVAQAVFSSVGGQEPTSKGPRFATETNHVIDLSTGRPVNFKDGFRYATLRRMDGTIAADPSGKTDEGILTAALKAMGPRSQSQCMRIWLRAQACDSLGTCKYDYSIPKTMTLFPTEEGLAVQFMHWKPRPNHRPSTPPPEPTEAELARCVQDAVTLPWSIAKRAVRSDVKFDLP